MVSCASLREELDGTIKIILELVCQRIGFSVYTYMPSHACSDNFCVSFFKKPDIPGLGESKVSNPGTILLCIRKQKSARLPFDG